MPRMITTGHGEFVAYVSAAVPAKAVELEPAHRVTAAQIQPLGIEESVGRPLPRNLRAECKRTVIYIEWPDPAACQGQFEKDCPSIFPCVEAPVAAVTMCQNDLFDLAFEEHLVLKKNTQHGKNI